jgi:DNA-binding transcriptional MerR regulator/effector-binding domain-containing protein
LIRSWPLTRHLGTPAVNLKKVAVDSPIGRGLSLLGTRRFWWRLDATPGREEIVRMFTIGDFSKITGLTVKTIRFYHEKGLLAPTCVDEQTGYRYYDRSKVERARAISHLRSLDLSLEEIGEILRTAQDDADLRQVMSRQKDLLEAGIERYRDVVRSLDAFLNDQEEARRIMAQSSFQVEEKVTDPLTIASVRMKGRYPDCGAAFGRIGKRFGRFVRGKPLLLLHDAEYRETDADFEACLPVIGGQSVDCISVRDLPAARCMTLLHQGPYEELGRSYAKVLEYVRAKGYEIVMPTREVYHKGPGMIFRGNPRNYLTEIQIPVAS